MPHIAAIGFSLAILVSLESTLAAAGVDRLFPKLRPRDAWVTSLIAEGSRRSATFRRLADRLATLKVIIYIESRMDLRDSVDGAARLMAAAGGHRYVHISLRSGCARDQSIAILGHELQHALEIAEAADIVDAESMAAFYHRAGVRSCPGAAIECYDTARAREIGEAVLIELQKGGGRAP